MFHHCPFIRMIQQPRFYFKKQILHGTVLPVVAYATANVAEQPILLTILIITYQLSINSLQQSGHNLTVKAIL